MDTPTDIESSGERARHREQERFRNIVALIVAIQALFLTVASLGGGNTGKEMVNTNILASDTWAMYQAKNLRQTAYQLAMDQVSTMLIASGTSVSPEERKQIEARLDDYRAKIVRYESEPDPADPGNVLKGDGKKELRARALYFEARRDRASRQDPNFDYATALFQIAIVLGSIAILSGSRPVFIVSIFMSLASSLLMLNGFWLWFDLPF